MEHEDISVADMETDVSEDQVEVKVEEFKGWTKPGMSISTITQNILSGLQYEIGRGVTTISLSPPKILNIRIFRFQDKNLSLKNYIKFGHYHSGFNIKLLVRIHKIIMLSTNIDIDINFVSIFRKIRYDDQRKFTLTQMKFGLIFAFIHLNFFCSNLVTKVKFLRFLSYHFTYLYF